MLSLIEPLAEIVAAVNVPVSVGDADRTTLPVPVLVVTPVPPFATGKVPVTPAVRLIWLHEGAADAPPETKAYPLVP